MTTLICRNITKECMDSLTAADSQEIQKAYLQHVHAKHAMQWSQFSQQYKSVSVVAMRNRFTAQAAEDMKAGASVSPA